MHYKIIISIIKENNASLPPVILFCTQEANCLAALHCKTSFLWTEKYAQLNPYVRLDKEKTNKLQDHYR